MLLFEVSYVGRCDSVESFWSLKHWLCFGISCLLWLCSSFGCFAYVRRASKNSGALFCTPFYTPICTSGWWYPSRSMQRICLSFSHVGCLEEFSGILLHNWMERGKREGKRGFVYEHNTRTLVFCIIHAHTHAALPVLQGQRINHIVLYYIPPYRTLGFVFL